MLKLVDTKIVPHLTNQRLSRRQPAASGGNSHDGQCREKNEVDPGETNTAVVSKCSYIMATGVGKSGLFRATKPEDVLQDAEVAPSHLGSFRHQTLFENGKMQNIWPTGFPSTRP